MNPADGTPETFIQTKKLVPTKPMPDHDWNEHYASGHMPWDSNEPDPALVATVEAGMIRVGRALEVGCGTGTNALWLRPHALSTRSASTCHRRRSIAPARRWATARSPAASRTRLPEGPARWPVRLCVRPRLLPCVRRRQDTCAFCRVSRPCAQSRRPVAQPGGQHRRCAARHRPAPAQSRDIASAVEPALECAVAIDSLDTEVDMPPAAWLCLSRARAPFRPSRRRARDHCVRICWLRLSESTQFGAFGLVLRAGFSVPLRRSAAAHRPAAWLE